MGRPKALTTGDIEDALNIAARVVDRFGYKYWPIFERLEAELESRTSREDRLRARLGRSSKAERALGHPNSSEY